MTEAQLEAWRALVKGFALAADPAHPGRWSGVVDGVAVRLEAALGAAGGVGLAASTGRPTLLVLPMRSALRLDERRLSGDPIFDRDVFLLDADPLIHALLDLETRTALHQLVVGRGVVAGGGELRLGAEAAAELGADAIGRCARDLLDLARRLARLTSEVAVAALVRIAADDPIDAVRATVARLADELPALRDALATASLQPADQTDRTDHAFARLAAIAQDETLGAPARGAALTRLVQLFPPSRFAPLVLRLRATLGLWVFYDVAARAREPGPDARALGEVLAAYVSQGDERAAQALQAMMTLELDGATLLQLLGPRGRSFALGRTPDLAKPGLGLRGDLVAALLPGTEPNPLLGPAYLRALGAVGDARFAALATAALASPYEGVTEAAVAALAAIGDLPSVAALKPLTSGLFRSGELKAAATRAIEAIRQRHGARENPGALSLSASDRAGGLSLGDAAAKDDPP
ncbi:MAG: hypothetical protein U1F43_35860 [Myxococcota bacterium]